MNVSVQFRKNDNTLQGFVEGELDTYTAPMLREELDSIQLFEGMSIELDLSNVRYMDSTGLGVFVAFYKKVMKQKANLKLVALSSRLARLFEITGLSELMEIESVKKV
ncbi:STAS domain-containing protein [Lysinibacillus endophyticus]|uniref:Anti-sigma factor antagonist n=1 Tax=Ureibacillus endophyticus TaxID=1978490 RepID=A0A494ZB25_9BACL|nr:STAS domain-containing protein [Lysinibacillus endophyticus]MCP1146263.1 STAS domain-containing protein [Lysinibacillus endophyticus]RKQ19613.1 anti-sigma factor antagonist [Lysinibacillus endophyticus]